MQELRFAVRGSSGEPYQVLATGEGDGLRITCTCAAGRFGRTMCRHVAALLVGDVSAVVEGVDGVTDLARRADGGPLIAAALAHEPRAWSAKVGAADFVETGDFAEDLGATAREAERRGWVVALSSTALECFGLTPTGRRRKAPDALILFDPMADRTPYTVQTPGAVGVRRRVKNLSYAVKLFIDTLGVVGKDVRS